jgi:hypothetical protein
LQRIQQAQVSLGLCFGRGIGRQPRAEIAEAGRRHDAIAIAENPPPDLQPLIETASRSMDDEHRRTISALAELDRPVSRVDDLPLRLDS